MRAHQLDKQIKSPDFAGITFWCLVAIYCSLNSLHYNHCIGNYFRHLSATFMMVGLFIFIIVYRHINFDTNHRAPAKAKPDAAAIDVDGFSDLP